MSALTGLTIKGFRRLLDVEIPLRPLQVLIGVNGCGKTSVLDALSLLAAASRGDLARALSTMGGIGDVLTRDRAHVVELGVTVQGDGESAASLAYRIALEPKGQGFWIPRESLVARPSGGAAPFEHIESLAGDARYFDGRTRAAIPITASLQTTCLSSYRSDLLPQAQALPASLDSMELYGTLDVQPRSPIRLPQRMQPADLPGRGGEDLVSALYNLREADEDRFEVLQDTLRAGFPDFEKLAFPPAATGLLSMTWKDKSFSKPLYMHQLSEGTLRFLWLATLLQSRSIGAVTLLEEPEIGFHPELQRLLIDLMREVSKRTTLIVTTHSDRFVRFIEPEELLIMDTDEGIAKVTRADQHAGIADWLSDYGLDELWRAGRLGGRS